MSSTLTRSCVLLCGLAMLAPAAAEAQFGGLGNRVRRAVQEATAERPAQPAEPTAGAEAAAADAASAAAPAAGKSPYNDHVLQITPELLDRLALGLGAEAADRAEAAKTLAAIPTREEYDQCVAAAYVNPAGQPLVADMRAKGEAFVANPSDAAAAAAYQQAQQAYNAHVRQQCGPPASELAAQQQELQQRPEKSGASAAGLTADQYAILKERVLPLCGMAAAGDGEVRIPGEGKEIYWVYSQAEVATLRPRCGQLLPLVQASA